MAAIVSGYKEFMKATQYAGRDVKREVRQAFRKVGAEVREDAERNFSRYGSSSSARRTHTMSAAGYRVSVRQRGVEVESARRKTTGRHPEYGVVQMRRGLIPAKESNEPMARARMERAMDEVVQIFERRAD